ncbi:MAG: heme ABC transporter ATP-binding protein [Microbacterium sp.]|uniref:ABC transporter ATP-binding protein n=1 Tax=Microbacterium sp. TaxID=51671 RepID=UPI000DB2D2C7|nr:ABC transporter ATP-binding protein [Microbacterium sp.]PZU39903.1 MAG: heme ABC transporter ATP-binding protein [Microbacterium sp.]
MLTTSGETPRLELRGLRKYFAASGVLAVADVSLEVAPGEVLALIGENGTGKTTLMNLLFGVHSPDAGEIFIDGKSVEIRGQQDAIRNGIGMVHQHFELVPSFTVAQNVLLGREPQRGGFFDNAAAEKRVAELARETGFHIDPRQVVHDLPVGAQQRVEILKSLAADARLLILDEPTAVLTPSETDDLLVMVRTLAASGRSVVFISHKLPEVQAIADRIVVMRRGEVVGDLARGEATDAELARLMVGRDVLLTALRADSDPGDVLLSLSGVTAPPSQDGSTGLKGVDLELRAGEIIGLAGVSGNGQDELVDAIAALSPAEEGSIRLSGTEISRKSPAEVRTAGVAHIAADRMHVGLNLLATLEENAVSTRFSGAPFSRWGIIRKAERRAFAQRIVSDYEVRGGAPGRVVGSLSGGNLQKVVIGRELSGEPRVVLANQPTRGLDVGSIEFVHSALSDARASGAGVLLVSTELEEIFALSDRIAVMFDGELIGPFPCAELDRERLGRLMTGGASEAPETPADVPDPKENR